MKKIDQKRVKDLSDHLVSGDGKEKFPQLYGFLNDAVFVVPGGVEPREPGTMFIMPRAGVLHVWLKEPSQALMMHIEATSLHSLLATVEAALGDEGSMWEKDRNASARKKKK